jgi:hypothetical protein
MKRSNNGSPCKKGINVSQFDKIIEGKLGRGQGGERFDEKISPIFKYKL